MIIKLSREKVAFRFTDSAYLTSKIIVQMKMMEQRFAKIKKFRIHWPGTIFFKQFRPQQISSQLLAGISKEELTVLACHICRHIAHPFICRCQRTVHCCYCRAKPAFFNRSASGAKCEIIVRMQSQTTTCRGKPSRYKNWYHPKDTGTFFKCFFNSFRHKNLTNCYSTRQSLTMPQKYCSMGSFYPCFLFTIQTAPRSYLRRIVLTCEPSNLQAV